MQRGAQVRKQTFRMRLREEYGQAPVLLTAAERSHFGLGSMTQDQFLSDLRPSIRNFSKGGIRKPLQVAQALNRARRYTACGERWTPRLAWLLLQMLFNADREV